MFILTCWAEHSRTINKGTRDTEGVNAAPLDTDRSKIELYMKEPEIIQGG